MANCATDMENWPKLAAHKAGKSIGDWSCNGMGGAPVVQLVGYVEAELMGDTVLGKAGTKMRGHEFHFSEDAVEGKRPLRFEKLRTGERYEAGASRGNVLGSYLHLHFAGCPAAAAHFVEACTSWAR